jgi:hypothetical protein
MPGPDSSPSSSSFSGSGSGSSIVSPLRIPSTSIRTAFDINRQSGFLGNKKKPLGEDGMDYLLWIRNVKIWLVTNDLMKFVKPLPSDRWNDRTRTMDFQLTMTSNATDDEININDSIMPMKVFMVIFNSLSIPLQKQMMTINESNPYLLLQTLSQRFNSSNISHVMALRDQLHELIMKPSERLDEFISRLSALITRLADHGSMISDDDIKYYTLRSLPISMQEQVKSWMAGIVNVNDKTSNKMLDWLKCRYAMEPLPSSSTPAEFQLSSSTINLSAATASSHHDHHHHRRHRHHHRKNQMHHDYSDSTSTESDDDSSDDTLFACNAATTSAPNRHSRSTHRKKSTIPVDVNSVSVRCFRCAGNHVMSECQLDSTVACSYCHNSGHLKPACTRWLIEELERLTT